MVFCSNAMLVPAWTFLVLLTATFEVVSSVNGGWSDWTDWESCSVSCGQGSKRRYRFCNNPAPSSNGVWCAGKPRDVADCSGPFECPVDGDWGQWSVWTPCSVSCGEGIVNRYRNCDSPAPANGGAACKGNPIETVKCFAKKECPRDGGWSSWSLWSPCSVTCGDDGQSSRHRACNHPLPTGDGKSCSGSSQQLNRCIAPVKCGVNGQWSEWTVWSPCSVTCGSGVRNRWRRCDNPPPQNGGQDCNREDAGEMQERSCNGSIVFCPVDGGWSDWGDWTDCETSNCNNHKEFSYRYRERSCTNPHPAHKGSMCQGAFLNAGFCEGPVNCAVNGGWSEWTPWDCTSFLGARSRTCDNPRPSNGGKPCRGNNLETYTFDRDRKRFGELCPDFVGKAEAAGGEGGEVPRAGDDEDLKEGSASDYGENEMAEDDDI